MKWVSKLQKLGEKHAVITGVDYSFKGDVSNIVFKSAAEWKEVPQPELLPIPQLEPITIDTSMFTPELQKKMLSSIEKAHTLPTQFLMPDTDCGTLSIEPAKVTLEQALDVLAEEVGISSIHTSFQQDAGTYPHMELNMKLSPAKAHVLGILHGWAIKQGGKSW